MLSAIMLSVVVLCDFIMNAIMQSTISYTEYHYATFRYSMCHCAEWHYAMCRYAECHYTECPIQSVCAYNDFHYAECHYTECNGTAHIRHHCWETTVLRCYRYLINYGAEQINNIYLFIKILTTRCRKVKVNSGIPHRHLRILTALFASLIL